MLDVLGIVDLRPRAAADVPMPAICLPSERYVPDRAREVRSPRVRARFLERSFGPPAYAEADQMHLFVVGEIYRRRLRRTGPLGASDVLAEYRRAAPTLLESTKGNFVLVAIDEQAATCELIASRLYSSPFYYALDDGRLLFSTALASLMASLKRPARLDRAAVAELSLFNYPLGARSYVQNVSSLRPAEVVRVEHGQLGVRRWWDVRQLYERPLLKTDDALEVGSTLLHDTVNDLVCDQPRVRLSFTSGFDSRVNLAVLERDPSDLLAYAFGIRGSINVEVPRQVSARLGLRFEPIYLDQTYEDQFDEYALRTLALSDCLSTVERANYPYAFERTADFAPVVLTGLFGSELLRTFQNIGYIVSSDLVQLNLSNDPASDVRALADVSRYIPPRLVHQHLEEIEADVATVFDEHLDDMPADRRFYLLLLTEALRKYFGAETHIERPWGLNRFPFLDEEFVEFAFQAPFAGVHSRTLTPTIGNRFRSQYFYTHVIKRYRPELLHAPTDHGYAPADLLSPFALLRIAPKLFMQRRRQRRAGYREFKTEEWTAQLYRRHLQRRPLVGDVFDAALFADFESGEWLDHRLEFARAASLKLWVEQLDGLLSWE